MKIYFLNFALVRGFFSCHCEPILIGVAISSTYTHSIFLTENQKLSTKNWNSVPQFAKIKKVIEIL